MTRKILIALFLIHIFFMFYNLEKWAPFGWDQVDNAWAAMRILTVNKYPLLGMVAKGNSGIYIGPLYYYLVSVFYFFTRLDPIAAPILAGITSVFSFWVIYIVTKRLINERVALVSLFIYTFSSFVVAGERVQWPVNFIAPLSLLILYSLHKIISGKPKYFLHLGILVGLSFHVHFTALFFPIITVMALPLVRWNRSALRYFIFSIVLGLVFFIPQIIYYLQSHHSGALTTYFQTSYHGLHLRRVFQLLPDAFIKFQSVLMTPFIWIRAVSWMFVPTFVLLYRKKLSYLVTLWFLVPWVILSTYSGEISDYYFSLQSYPAIIILAYLTIRIWDLRYTLVKIVICICWLYWTVTNVQQFFRTNPGELPENRVKALEASMTARIIPFTEGDPESYLYYYYMYRSHKWLPYKL